MSRTRSPDASLSDVGPVPGEPAAWAAGKALPAGIEETAFKMAMRQVASSVAVITSRAGSRINGLTATAVCSVSASPPVLLACVNKGASAEAIIAESGVFAVNFLTEQQHVVARLFSTSKLSPEERFGEGRWQVQATGAPVLEGALASFDCLVENCIASGTHSIYFGRVVAAESLDQEGLIYRDGSFRRLAPVT
ncbi:flavin reductase family protein [Aquibium microcysteis]|uniref:flavin reductase family protein n=1 Tax=Aquibium microcysteis TaxID=675281 RepID=UPI001AED2269|nr:flavin reductase family protein [Aquibium microcysteis]